MFNSGLSTSLTPTLFFRNSPPLIDNDCLLDLMNLAIHTKLRQVKLQDEDALTFT